MGIQGVLAYRALTEADLNPWGLVWGGSIIFSMMPLLVGSAATGKFSDGVELSTAMNAPYVAIPVALAYQLFRPASYNPARGRKRRSTSTELDSVTIGIGCVAAASHCVLVLLHTVQIMSVLGSKASIATWWLTEVEPVLKQVRCGLPCFCLPCLGLPCLGLPCCAMHSTACGCQP